MTAEEIQFDSDEPLTRPEAIYVEREEKVATIVLNRPATHHAVTLGMWRAIPGIINALSADDSLRCIVLRSTGEEAFCAGCDIGEFADIRANKEQAIVYGQFVQEALVALGNCRHPIVAQIEGICLGAGMELLASCDIRICSESSVFGIPAKNLGLALSYVELAPFIPFVGKNTLLEMLLEGRVLSAQEAKEKQIVTRVVENDAIAEEVNNTVQRIIQGAPLAARWHKKFVRRLADPRPITPEEYDECFDCFDTEDYRIGCAAFLLRDHPLFKGK